MSSDRKKCAQCPKTYKTSSGLAKHVHQYHTPPHVPRKEIVIEGLDSEVDEKLTLLMTHGTRLPKVGQTFWHVRRFVVLRTEREKIDGVLQPQEIVTARCTKRHWAENEPS